MITQLTDGIVMGAVAEGLTPRYVESHIHRCSTSKDRQLIRLLAYRWGIESKRVRRAK